MAQAIHRTAAMRIRDVLLYCAIATVVAAAAILIGFCRARAGLPLGLPVKWIGFAIMTALVFLNAFRSYRVSSSRPRFWVLMTLFSIFHFAVGIIIVRWVAKIGLIDFAIATLIEYFALNAYLNHFMERRQE
jgi:hypothetical protein